MSFQEIVWWLVLIAVASYFYGNVNNAVLISAILGKDVRKEGSGNPGTLNMSRVFGIKIGALVLVLDILKGTVPALIARLCFGNATFLGGELPVGTFASALAGLFVVTGHIFPVLYGFKGGKGVASTIGVLAVFNWWIMLIVGAIAIAFIFITGVGSVGSFIAITPPAIYFGADNLLRYALNASLTGDALYAFIFTNVCALLMIIEVYVAHRKNIVRLFKGEEHKTDWAGMVKKLKDKKKKEEPEV
ncbi:MAG TPA: hypothetical protein DDY77_04200 [Clostridiales bacterium]|nr:hypothetical protein [Clostridiales bacterium]